MIIIKIIDWQLKVGWGTNSSNTEVLDFTTIPYTVFVSYSHLNYPWLNFGNGIYWYFVFLITKSRFCSCDICRTINPDCGNHHVRWLFKDKYWGKKFAMTRDWTPISHSTARCHSNEQQQPPTTITCIFFTLLLMLGISNWKKW